MEFYLPIHIDSGNRGCEAITTATAEILRQDQITVLTRDLELDRTLGLDKNVKLIPDRKENILFKAKRKIACAFGCSYKTLTYTYHYYNFIRAMEKNSIMLSTGGDMLCYDDNQVIYTNELAKSFGCKTILWGCSVGKENLSPAKEKTLHNFDYIYARESITASLLKEIGCKNVGLFPDPAFILNTSECELPGCFLEGRHVIGLNISNYIVGSNDLNSTRFGAALRETLNYIINNTDFNILLIPHVFWDGQDDRIISNNILEEYRQSNRVFKLLSESLDYRQIRYIISKCYIFCGGRTHSVISAYSTCVPSIALGYSIKSRGIAKDLQLPNETVVNCKSMSKSNDFLTALKYVIDHRDELKSLLDENIPDYKRRLYEIRETICNQLNNVE